MDKRSFPHTSQERAWYMQLPSAVVAAGVNVCSISGWQSSATDCATRKGGNEEGKGVGKALTAWAMASTAVPMRCSDSNPFQ